MKAWAVLFLRAITVLCIASAANAQSNFVRAQNVAPGQLRIAGSSTMTPLVTAIAQRLHARYPQVDISVESGGSGRGLADARAGKADIGMVSRALGEGDNDLYSLPIARDGVAVVIHGTNPVHSLTVRQIAEIYAGKIFDWKQVGGTNAPIVVIKSEEKRSSSELFTHYFQLRYEDMKSQLVAGDNAKRIELLLKHPNAIVYMSVGEAERNAQKGVPLKLLPIDGVAASSRTIRSGDYPIARPLTLVTKGIPAGLAKLFIEYAASSQVSDLVAANDFVPYLD
ncbi:MAG TPA: phosphate ABC transporter substrate-binding protein [Pseudoduganella sp.]